MKTTNIKWKEYVMVNERINYFWENYKTWSIQTDIVKLEDWFVCIKATIYVDDKIVSTWHAYEVEGSTFINKTSFIENCETSAVWRALGNFGIGVDESVATAEEVNNAIEAQGNFAERKTIRELQSLVKNKYNDLSDENKEKFAKLNYDRLTEDQARKLIDKLNSK